MAEPDGNIITQNVIDTNKLSHKKRKALWKKERRKSKRQAEAKERDEKLKIVEDQQRHSPSYAARVAAAAEQERGEILQMEAESHRQRELWVWHEDLYKQRLREKQEQAERETQQRIETEKKIKAEWEERQKKEKEEEEEKRKKKEKQDELLRQAREAENKDADWSNPLAPVHYGKERQIDMCPFFAKVAACRFGNRCSRAHPFPDSSRTLLFVSMFRHFQLDQGLCEEYDADIVLEYEDNEVYQKFKEFYDDTLPEFKVIGHVLQFKVCCNFQPHLRGNVYVSYSSEDHAFEAFTKFNARWYGGKQISAQFVEIPSWRRAICGLFGKGRCPKGKECNFLHVFKNPCGEFNLADRDMEPFTPRQDYRHSSRRHRSRSQERRHSPSRSSRRFRHSRSRSRERHCSYNASSRYSRQRSPDRHSRSRHRSRSPEYRSHSTKNRSKSPEYRSHSTRNRSRSPEYRSHSTKNRSRSPEYRSHKNRSRSPKYRSHSSRQRSRSPSRKSRLKQSNISRNGKDRSRSKSTDSESSIRENVRTCVRSKEKKIPAVCVDNIEEKYEKGLENECTATMWVEKTLDTIKTSKETVENVIHSGIKSSIGRKRRSKSDTSTDSSEDNAPARNRKTISKKHKRVND